MLAIITNDGSQKFSDWNARCAGSMTEQDPLRFVDLMVEAGIPFVVIGGHAVNVHGFARATEDVDLLYQRSRDTDAQLCEVLDDINAFYIGNELDPETGIEKTYPVTIDYIHQNQLMMLGSDLGYIDLFTFVPGIPNASVEELIASAEHINDRPFVSLAWLRKLKEASGRPQDLIDIENLPSE